jgi:hypothetical protein
MKKSIGDIEKIKSRGGKKVQALSLAKGCV